MDASPISLGTYAKRRGISKQAVSKAIAKGRLSASVARDAAGKLLGIADPEAADREWEAATDLTRASAAMKERAGTRAAAPAPAQTRRASPPAGEPDDLNISKESAREKHWRANKAEIEYRELIGELVNAAEMKEAVADAFARVRSRLSGLPTRVRQQIPHLTVDEVAIVDSFVREALDELALKLESEDAEGDDDGGADAA